MVVCPPLRSPDGPVAKIGIGWWSFHSSFQCLTFQHIACFVTLVQWQCSSMPAFTLEKSHASASDVAACCTPPCAVGGNLFSKLCATCASHNKNPKNKDVPLPEHHCASHFEGSSGTMEPQACVDIAVKLRDQCQVAIEMLCMDDNATTRSALQ